jgi:peroxiredoxin Q/BCP
MSVELGQIVPDFSCIADDEVMRSLESQRGNWLVLFFYPKASTPGCTIESKDFSALKGEFDALGCTVWGCSGDSVRRQCNFRDKQELTVALLADEDKVVHDVFGAWAEKKNYGRTYMGTVRSTYLIDPQGRLAQAWPKLRVKGHADAVLQALREAQ